MLQCPRSGYERSYLVGILARRRTLYARRNIDAPRANSLDGRFDVGDAQAPREHDLRAGGKLASFRPVRR
jgi:hypothetical protein